MKNTTIQHPAKATKWLKSALATSIGAILLAQGLPALAQEASTDKEEEDLEHIEVFATTARAATKTDADLMEVPQAISVVTSDQFLDRGAVNFQDIFRYSAGVSTENAGVDTRTDSFSARGFNTVQFLDGLNRQPDFIYGARMEVFTIERAEILRGPSAVLYGAGSAGGIFNAVSKTPRAEFGGEVALQIGTDNRQQLMADVTGALNEDVSSRLVTVARDANLQPEDQADDRFVLMPSIKWTVGDDTDITFLFLYQKDNMGTHTYYGVDLEADPLPIDFFAGDKDFNRMDTIHTSFTLMVDHQFTDNISYSGRSRFFDQLTDYAEVYGFMPDTANNQLSRLFYFLDENYKVLNSDHNLKYSFEHGNFEHQILIGADYIEFRQDREEGWGVAPTLDLNNPDYHMDFETDVLNAYTTRSTQTGYYIQDQIRYDEWLSMVIGLRRDKSTSELSGVTEEPNTATTARLGIIADLGSGFSPYVSYSESFLPVFGADFFGVPFKPQEGEQIEVGLKYQPNRDTLITFAIYDVEESNRLTPDPDEIQNTLQAGLIESSGYEIEIATRLFDTVTLNAAFSDTDSSVIDENPDVDDLKVADVPERLASMWLNNQFIDDDDFTLSAGIGVRYVDEKNDALNRFITPSATVMDLSFEVTYEDFSFHLSGNNVLNKEYFAACQELGPATIVFCSPAMDRRILGTMSYRF